MPSFKISKGRDETIVDEEDAWRLRKFHYFLKVRKRKDGTERRYALRDADKLSPEGLKVRSKRGRIIKMRIFLHKEILEAKLGREIRAGYMTDHADGNGLNNPRSNLREVTNAQNKANQRKQTGATSKYKGVSWYHPTRQWQAQIKKDRKTIPFGHFDTEIEAAQAYDAAARVLYGDFARLNFPDPPHIIERVKRSLVRYGMASA
jgi:hypothetical protein